MRTMSEWRNIDWQDNPDEVLYQVREALKEHNLKIETKEDGGDYVEFKIVKEKEKC